MARSHHRKKHKEHLRQYQKTTEGVTSTRRAKVTGTFIAIGIILGIAIGYFSTGGELPWVIGVAVVGGVAGWFAGRYFDADK